MASAAAWWARSSSSGPDTLSWRWRRRSSDRATCSSASCSRVTASSRSGPGLCSATTQSPGGSAAPMIRRLPAAGVREPPAGTVGAVDNEVEVVAFDVFGTLVDWHTSMAAALARVGGRAGIEADWPAVANAWRALYHPTLQRVLDGGLPFQPLDTLHRMMLDQVAGEHGLDALT